MRAEEIKSKAEELNKEIDTILKDLPIIGMVAKKCSDQVYESLRRMVIVEIEFAENNFRIALQNLRNIYSSSKKWWVGISPEKFEPASLDPEMEQALARAMEKDGVRMLPLEEFEKKIRELKISILKGKLDKSLREKTGKIIDDKMREPYITVSLNSQDNP